MDFDIDLFDQIELEMNEKTVETIDITEFTQDELEELLLNAE